MKSLGDIQIRADEASSSKASLLITALENFEFLVTLHVLKDVFREHDSCLGSPAEFSAGSLRGG